MDWFTCPGRTREMVQIWAAGWMSIISAWVAKSWPDLILFLALNLTILLNINSPSCQKGHPNSYHGPAWDEQNKALGHFLKHHGQQVQETTAQGALAWGRSPGRTGWAQWGPLTSIHGLINTLGAVHENHIRPFSETVWCVQTAPLLMETPLLPGFGTLRLGATWCRAPIFHFHSEKNTVTLGALLALLSRKSRGPDSQDFVHSVPKCATSLTAFHFLQYWDPPLGWQPANHVVPFAAACPPKSDSGGPHSSPHLSVFCQTRQAPEDMDSLSLRLQYVTWRLTRGRQLTLPKWMSRLKGGAKRPGWGWFPLWSLRFLLNGEKQFFDQWGCLLWFPVSFFPPSSDSPLRNLPARSSQD